MLRCHEGFLAEKQTDDELRALFLRRAGPIAAAFAITIDAPPGAGD